MSNFYSDSKFGVITRQWFGLSTKLGGAAASTYTLGTTDATIRSQVARWYPRGPIKFVKFGSIVVATLVNNSVDRVPVRLRTKGASASNAGVAYSAKTLFSIASTTTFSPDRMEAGDYISIVTGTPQTSNGTAANTATTTGSLGFFLDYVPTYDSTGKHDVTQSNT